MSHRIYAPGKGSQVMLKKGNHFKKALFTITSRIWTLLQPVFPHEERASLMLRKVGAFRFDHGRHFFLSELFLLDLVKYFGSWNTRTPIFFSVPLEFVEFEIKFPDISKREWSLGNVLRSFEQHHRSIFFYLFIFFIHIFRIGANNCAGCWICSVVNVWWSVAYSKFSPLKLFLWAADLKATCCAHSLSEKILGFI